MFTPRSKVLQGFAVVFFTLALICLVTPLGYVYAENDARPFGPVYEENDGYNLIDTEDAGYGAITDYSNKPASFPYVKPDLPEDPTVGAIPGVPKTPNISTLPTAVQSVFTSQGEFDGYRDSNGTVYKPVDVNKKGIPDMEIFDYPTGETLEKVGTARQWSNTPGQEGISHLFQDDNGREMWYSSGGDIIKAKAQENVPAAVITRGYGEDAVVVDNVDDGTYVPLSSYSHKK